MEYKRNIVNLDEANKQVKKIIRAERKNYYSNIKWLLEQLQRDENWDIKKFLTTAVPQSERHINYIKWKNFFEDTNYPIYKNLSIEEAFDKVKKGYKIYREGWLKGDCYYINDEENLVYYSSTENKTVVGILSFLNPINMNDWVAEKLTGGDNNDKK